MKIGVRNDGDLDSVASEILEEAEGTVTHGVFAAGRAYVTTGGDRFAALSSAPPCQFRPAGRLPAMSHFPSRGQYCLDQGARYPSRFQRQRVDPRQRWPLAGDAPKDALPDQVDGPVRWHALVAVNLAYMDTALRAGRWLPLAAP